MIQLIVTAKTDIEVIICSPNIKFQDDFDDIQKEWVD